MVENEVDNLKLLEKSELIEIIKKMVRTQNVRKNDPSPACQTFQGFLSSRRTLGHVGVYIGKDAAGKRQYIESTPTWNKWGVTQSNDEIHKRAFWGKYSYITYIESIKETIISEIKVGDIVLVSGVGRGTSLGTGGSTASLKNRRMKVIKIISKALNAYGCSVNLNVPVGKAG